MSRVQMCICRVLNWIIQLALIKWVQNLLLMAKVRLTKGSFYQVVLVKIGKRDRNNCRIKEFLVCFAVAIEKYVIQ